MLRVGLSGGVGSGRSTGSNFFDAFGSFVVNAEEEAKELMSSNETVQHGLIADFGAVIIDVSGQINKAKLAKIAFQDEDHQQTLNSVIHPYIYDSIDNQFNRVLKNGKFDIFIVDGALIFESGYDVHMDYIIVVTALLKNRIERALGRKTLSRDEILKRINLQWSEEEKVNLADFVIHNDGSEEDLKNNVKSLIEKLI